MNELSPEAKQAGDKIYYELETSPMAREQLRKIYRGEGSFSRKDRQQQQKGE